MKYIIIILLILGAIYLVGQDNIFGNIMAVVLAIVVLYLWMTHNPFRRFWGED